MNRNPHVAVVGATGAVGVEMIKTLERRNFPVGKLTLLASARSAGKQLKFRGEAIPIKELTKDSFTGIEIALFSAGGGASKEFAPLAARDGCVVIDNSSAFRMDDAVPLVIPEINARDAKSHQGIIANPNCTTAVTLMRSIRCTGRSKCGGFLRPAIRPCPGRAQRRSKNSNVRWPRS